MQLLTIKKRRAANFCSDAIDPLLRLRTQTSSRLVDTIIPHPLLPLHIRFITLSRFDTAAYAGRFVFNESPTIHEFPWLTIAR